ncbi:ATP-binding protein [Thermincola ferriacetica]
MERNRIERYYYPLLINTLLVLALTGGIIGQFASYQRTIWAHFTENISEHAHELAQRFALEQRCAEQDRALGRDHSFSGEVLAHLANEHNYISTQVVAWNIGSDSKILFRKKGRFASELKKWEEFLSGPTVFFWGSRFGLRHVPDGYLMAGTGQAKVGNSLIKTEILVEANGFIREQSRIALSLAVVLSAVISILAIQFRLALVWLYRPLEVIMDTMEQISAGNLSLRVAETTGGRIRSFIRSFNNMVSELDRSRKNLESELTRTKEQHALMMQIYSDVLYSVTQGKFLLLSPDRLGDHLAGGNRLGSAKIAGPDDVQVARLYAKSIIQQLYPDYEDLKMLLVCISEASTNIVKHALTGKMIIKKLDEKTLRFIFTDRGPGMSLDKLPLMLFFKGYSTKTSLGYGFKLIFEFASRVILSTSSGGTTVIFDVSMK